MTIGTTNTTELSFIKEVTPNVTPATPVMKRIRFKSEGLVRNNSTTESEEIRNDRATADLVVTDQSNGGPVTCELSGGAFDELIEAALFADATWTSVDNGGETTIAATATGFTDSGNGFVSAGIQVGQFLKFSGFTNAALAGYYRVVSVVAGEITTYPVPVATETAGQSVTYVGSTVKSGSTDASFTIQKAHKGVSPVVYENFRGMRVSSMSQNLAVGRLAEIAFNFLGQSSEVVEAQIAGRTETASPTNRVMNCVGDVTQIVAVGNGVSTAVFFTELSFNYDNALRELKAIGTLGAIAVRPGTINATATLNPYFETKEMLVAFLNNASFTLSWIVSSSDGYAYVFSFPNVRFTSQELAAGSKDADMIIASQVRAILDPSSLTTMRVDRFTP